MLVSHLCNYELVAFSDLLPISGLLKQARDDLGRKLTLSPFAVPFVFDFVRSFFR